MNTIIKRFFIILYITMVFTVSVFATTFNDIEPRYAYINAINSELVIDEQLGVASCEADIMANGSLKITVTCKLQRVTQNGMVTVATWNQSAKGILLFRESKPVVSGYKYRFYISGEISNSNGTVLEAFSKSYYYDYS